MKNRIRSATVICLLACILTAPVAMAQGRGNRMEPPSHGGPGGPPNPLLGPVDRILPELGLTDDQRSQIQEIVRGHVEGDMQATLQAYASQAYIEAFGQLALARYQLAQKVLEVLTEDQQSTLQQRIEQGPQGQGGPGGPGGRGRRG